MTSGRIRHERHRRIIRQQRRASESASRRNATGTRSPFERQRRRHWTTNESHDDVMTTMTTPQPRRMRRSIDSDEHEKHRLNHHGPSADGRNPGCFHRLVDRCAWPQCNSGCPNVRNPFTGNEMSVSELYGAARPDRADGTVAAGNGNGGGGYNESGNDDDEMSERLMALLMETARR